MNVFRIVVGFGVLAGILLFSYRKYRNTPCFSYGDIRHNVIELLLKW